MSEFSLFVIGQKTKSRTFSGRFWSTLSTYLDKSQFSLFVTGQKTKSRTSDFLQTFSSPSFRYLLWGKRQKVGLFLNVLGLRYRPILISPSFRYLLYGKRRKVGPRTFSKCFSSTLWTYLEKSEFSLFVKGQKTKRRALDFFQTFLVYVIDLS